MGVGGGTWTDGRRIVDACCVGGVEGRREERAAERIGLMGVLEEEMRVGTCEESEEVDTFGRRKAEDLEQEEEEVEVKALEDEEGSARGIREDEAVGWILELEGLRLEVGLTVVGRGKEEEEAMALS